MMALPLVIVLSVAALYAQFAAHAAVAGALRGMGAVAAGLIAGTALKLAAALRGNALGVPACVGFLIAAFIAVALLRLPLVWVLLGLGAPACFLAWRRLGARVDGGAP
jgi:chromate transporter